jgi:catechol 2,3-dioxygenase-like lactoylglutathione lyase family enzyme
VFERVTLHVEDFAASRRFYETVLPTLDLEPSRAEEQLVAWNVFHIVPATEDRPPTRRLHIGFAAPSREHVDEFWRAGTAAGYRDDGPPGPRPQYSPAYYGSFLLDPDGNSAEAVRHERVRRNGTIDHLWIRIADVAASKRFYEMLGERTGFGLVVDKPDLARFRGGRSSFTVVEGPVSENVEMAFAVGADIAADAVHDPDGNRVELVNPS